MKHCLKLTSSFDARVHGTFRDSEERKAKLTGQMDTPLKTESKSQPWTGSEYLADTNVSAHSSDSHTKHVSPTQWISYTHKPLFHTSGEQWFNRYVDKDYPFTATRVKANSDTCVSRLPLTTTGITSDPCGSRRVIKKQCEQKEIEKMPSLCSITFAQWDTPISDLYRIPCTWSGSSSSSSLRSSRNYGAKPSKQRKIGRTGKLSVGSQSASHVKQKKEGSEKTSLLSDPRALHVHSLPCSHSMVSLSKITRAKNNFTQINSSRDRLLKEFTPVITDDHDDENYRFQCSSPGLYQCSVSGLVFNMKGEGDVVYRTVPWNRRQLAEDKKKPAGPLFDIKCLQQSVCQLHLPHCEIISTGGDQSLQVAHVSDEGISFIRPHQVTETHVVLNISGFSAYGIVKDEESPLVPVQALVLLFYKPPEDSDSRSIINVLLLPRNILIRDVQRTRRKLNGEERYIDTSPHCKLHPKQVYTLSTSPKNAQIKVEPKETEFDDINYESYFTSFQVVLKTTLTEIHLSLRRKSSSSCVWKRKIQLFSREVETMNLTPSKRLFKIRSCFIESISEPVLKSLMDKLLEKKVITDAEKEAADAKKRREKASFVIDTVRKKGKTASSEMISFLRETDHILSEHLGLI